MTTLAAALIAAQKEMPAVKPNAVNPHFRSEFVTLDHLIAQTRPVLNKHGLAITQQPTHIDGQPALATTIKHESGESETSVMPLLVGGQDMQKLGAALTYARRYAWAAALGISADADDDGNQASAPVSPSPGVERAAPAAAGAAAPERAARADEMPAPQPKADADGKVAAGDVDVSPCGQKYAGKTIRNLTKGQLGWISGRWAPDDGQPYVPKTTEQELAQAAAQAYLDNPEARIDLSALAADAAIPF